MTKENEYVSIDEAKKEISKRILKRSEEIFITARNKRIFFEKQQRKKTSENVLNNKYSLYV